MRTPTLLAVAATLCLTPQVAQAAVVDYGVDFVRTSVTFDPRGADPNFLSNPGGTFRFDTDTNQLLSFDVGLGYPPSFNPAGDFNAQVLNLFASAGPCDLACFIGALDGQSWSTFSPGTGVFTRLNFGAPLSGSVIDGVPSALPRFGFSINGIVRVNGPVPEPGSWAMMLMGFGAIGWAMRRQKLAGALAA